MHYDITAGWTGPLDIRLLDDGETPAGTMAGMTAELVLRGTVGGVEVETAGDTSIQDSDAWVVRYAPDPLDLVPGDYHMRVKVTDAAGKVVFFPSGEWDKLKVWTQG